MAKKEKLSIGTMFESLANGLSVDDSENIVEWIAKNKIVTEEGLDFTEGLKERRYLVDWLNDMSPRQVTIASVQVAKTTGNILRMNYVTEMLGYNCAYSLPTMDLRDTIVQSNLDKLNDANDAFRGKFIGNSRMRKCITNGKIQHLIYTNGSAGAIAFHADLIIVDESSRSNQQTISDLEGRINNSEYKGMWLVTNPRTHDDHTHKQLKKSSQNTWFVKCSRCNEWNLLNWEGMFGYKGNLCRERKQLVCTKCDQLLRIEDVIDGKWVKRYPNREISGWWMHQLMRHDVSIPAMLDREDDNLQSFTNMFLGLPFSGSNISVSPSTVTTNLIPPFTSKKGVSMGIDIGSSSKHHFVIGVENNVMAMGKAEDFDELRAIIKKYNVQSFIVDMNPERESAYKLKRDYDENSLVAWYDTSGKQEELIIWNEEKGRADIAKHLYFDKIIRHLSEGRYKFGFQSNDVKIKEFCEHFGRMFCETKTDNNGNTRIVWDSISEMNHYAHAFLYFTVAVERFKMINPFEQPQMDTFDEAHEIKGQKVYNKFNPKEEKEEWYE